MDTPPPTVNPDKYLPNHNRSLYLRGQIGQDTLDELTPQILKMRAVSNQPITVFIDSIGGSIYHANQIRSLITERDINGETCEVVSVITSVAASAAADFACLSDYSYSTNSSRLCFHGSRRTLSDEDLTVEAALSIADSLRRTNENYSRQIAWRSFRRLVLIILSQGQEFADYREGKLEKTAIFNRIREQLGFAVGSLFDEAVRRQKDVTALSSGMAGKLNKLKPEACDAEWEKAMLLALVNEYCNSHKGDVWPLANGGLDKICSDFRLVHDYYFGRETDMHATWSKQFGQFFLSAKESDELSAMPTENPGARDDFIHSKSNPRIVPFWYLSVSIARILQREDYWMTPREAYWLGLIDEPIGENLPNFRTILKAGS